MKKIKGNYLGLLAVLLSPMAANADLIGILPATPDGSDWQAYYDDDTDLSWVADAWLAGTSMNWDDANAWVADLNINGVTGWRLPTALNQDGTGPCYGDGCDGSELGNLFFNTLGNTVGTVNAAVDTGPFSNVRRSTYGNHHYWSSTTDPGDPDYAWHLSFDTGRQLRDHKISRFGVWAVQSGNAASVPEPGTLALFGIGLAGMGLARRRRKA